MDWTKILEVAGPAVIGFVLGFLVKRYPTAASKANTVLGETGEALVVTATALADGKITSAEFAACLKEFKDIVAVLTEPAVILARGE